MKTNHCPEFRGDSKECRDCSYFEDCLEENGSAKERWHIYYGKLRQDIRHRAEEYLVDYPNGSIVRCPMLYPIQSPPENCKLALIPLGDFKFDVGYLNREGEMVYRTRDIPMEYLAVMKTEQGLEII